MHASDINNDDYEHNNLPIATVVTSSVNPTLRENDASARSLLNWVDYDTLYDVIVNPARGTALYVDNVAILSNGSQSSDSAKSSVNGRHRYIELITVVICICMGLAMGIYLYKLLKSPPPPHLFNLSPPPTISPTGTEDITSNKLNAPQTQNSTNQPSNPPSLAQTLDFTNQPSLTPIISGTSSIIPTQPLFFPLMQPSEAPSVKNSISPSPSQPTSLYWKQIYQDIPNDRSSVSLSYSGNVMAVSSMIGIDVFIEDKHERKWVRYGKNRIAKEDLEADATWEDMMKDSNYITSDVTLSHDGKSLLWYIAYKRTIRAEGMVILFELQAEADEWKQNGNVFNISHVPGSENDWLKDDFGPIVGFARMNGKRFIVPDRKPLVQMASVYEIKESKWQSVELPIIGYDLAMEDDIETNLEKLLALFSLFDPLFAASVGIDGEGERVVIASPHSGIYGDKQDTGKVETYELQKEQGVPGQFWGQIGRDMWGNGTWNNFGTVSFSNDGHRLAVGTTNKYTEKNGIVRVLGFDKPQNDWIDLLKIEEEEEKNDFGQMVSLSPDGNVLAVVAPKAGRICIYHLTPPKATKIGDCIEEGDPKERHEEYSISLSETGTRLAIGTPSAAAKVYELKII